MERTILAGQGQQLTLCRGVVAVSGERVDQAARRGLGAVPIEWQRAREKRDGDGFHITFFSKGDLQILQLPDATPADPAAAASAAAQLLAQLPCCWDWVDLGTGSCRDGGSESRFRVLLWPAAAELRRNLQLPPKDFHITLGFQNSDVHSKAKGLSTLSTAPEVQCLQALVALARKLPETEAISLAETALQGATAHADAEAEAAALRALCLCHGRLKQPDQVLTYADQLLQLVPADASARRSKGFALLLLQRHQDALEQLKLAQAIPEEDEAEARRVAQAVAFCCKKLGLEGPSAADGAGSGYKEAQASPETVAKDNYPKTPHLPFSPGVNPDDTQISDCQLLLQGEVVVTEKLDGGNCCIKGGQVYGRTHAQPASHESFSAVKELAANFASALEDVQVFGENMQGIHSIEYTNLESFFYVFGARDARGWLSWDETVALAERLDLPTVPLVFRGTFASADQLQQCLEKWKQEPSAVSERQTPEGFVVRRSARIPAKAFQESVAKYVRANHIQTEDAWKRRWKKATLGTRLQPRLRSLEPAAA
ncbi:unnamed protein product [Effrenium voratum]|uniref:RNA ligase domain-containing protein n=1 Tax=Effrenium voratum TaxID=2562239 RepID=A0AA36MLN4_9DINO|nr:unnamed protein product [Effrenium voratum]CAJ1430808.1 unnamed protein product [Effrenium voratum]